jgi:7-cyano-7-deazaguanine synthase in queuosine biosynthesis
MKYKKSTTAVMAKVAGDFELCSYCGNRKPTNRCGRCGLVKYRTRPWQRAGEASFSVLTVEDQKKMGAVLDMWTQTANQGCAAAQCCLGVI